MASMVDELVVDTAPIEENTTLDSPAEPPPQSPALRLVHVFTVSMSLPFISGQPAYMRQRGIEMHVVCSPGPELQQFADDEGVTPHPIPIPRDLRLWRGIRAIAELYRLFRRLRPDIIAAHTPQAGIMALMAAMIAGVPIRIYHMRGLPFLSARGVLRRFLMATEWLSAHLATHTIVVSHSNRMIALAQGFITEQNSSVIGAGSGQGVDVTKFCPERVSARAIADLRATLGIAAGQHVVAYVGRIAREKGVEELVLAWQQISQTCPDWQLVMWGPVEKRRPLSHAVRTIMADHPSIHLAGPCHDMLSAYGLADIIALPTYREGFPNVALEAAAMSRPIVATWSSGCMDAVVHDYSGILVPAGSVAPLADALEHYMGNPQLREQHGTWGRMRVEALFSRHEVIAAICAMYAQLVRRAA